MSPSRSTFKALRSSLKTFEGLGIPVTVLSIACVSFHSVIEGSSKTLDGEDIGVVLPRSCKIEPCFFKVLPW